ncbi:polysaccharide biosynthesis protein CapD [Gemmatimonadetes bacterium T265]|nr:polysaccharide biosynthesis protein CapD [Gemmatimonadetes bacterium T265]
MTADALLLGVAAALAFVVRFETWTLPRGVGLALVVYYGLALPLRLLACVRLGLYARMWRYAGTADLDSLLAAATASVTLGLFVGVLTPFLPGLGLPRIPYSVLALDGLLSALALALPRLALRLVYGRERRGRANTRRALVVGAGSAGSFIAREMRRHAELRLTPVAFVDDDPYKRNRTLQGVPVVGAVAEIPGIVRALGIDEIVIAMPSVSGAVLRRVMQGAQEVGVATRTVPGLFELISGAKSVSALRKVEIEDLLRRAPVQIDLDRVRSLADDKAVLVTGAGGSIGSELCRQIARLGPSRIVAVGRGENSVFELLQELARAFPAIPVQPVIADVRDHARLEAAFATFRPATVFHAAAHKHVPLMEQNVAEAVLNNVLGTQVVAELAARHGAERFVLISSDKAVRPSSVMGATKRLAEGVVQEVGRAASCRFVSVRFGNVLGSRGSVIPTFMRQIAAGGPVTITHPEMTRYFMTIPEAVQLVLQAGVMGAGGEVFALDMGEPVRVLDLARDLVRLSGLAEHEIEIAYTGMRPGEKLYEELFFDDENALPTEHPKVLRARNAEFDAAARRAVPGLIALAARNASADEIRHVIKRLVPEYTGVADPAPASAPAPVAAPTNARDLDVLATR